MGTGGVLQRNNHHPLQLRPTVSITGGPQVASSPFGSTCCAESNTTRSRQRRSLLRGGVKGCRFGSRRAHFEGGEKSPRNLWGGIYPHQQIVKIVSSKKNVYRTLNNPNQKMLIRWFFRHESEWLFFVGGDSLLISDRVPWFFVGIGKWKCPNRPPPILNTRGKLPHMIHGGKI